MKKRVQGVARWLATPWGATLVVALAWGGHSAANLSRQPMYGPDMYVILDTLQDDHSAAAVWSWFTGHWVQGPRYYRPVTSIVHWANFMLCGANPWGWRLTNVLIIAATFPALTWLCDRALAIPWAGPVAALALTRLGPASAMPHWPAWRTDALCGLFLLPATGAAVEYLKRGAPRSLWLTLGMLLLALMSKEVAFIWPLFALVLVLTLARNRRGAVLLGAAFALTGTLWLLRVHLLGHPLTGLPTTHVHYSLAREVRGLLRTILDPVYVDMTTTYPLLLPNAGWWASAQFWVAFSADITFILVNVLVGVASVRLLGVIWAWRVLTYIPAMPFARLWEFYYYIPSLGTALLYGVAAVVLARRVAQWVASTRTPRPDRADRGPSPDRPAR